MRLLNTFSLAFAEYFDEQTPQYAILSHRWGEQEVSFQDWVEGKKQDQSGYIKITKFCSIAREQGYEWVWIDTCCIDKKSSAELTEAINSMYRWYQKSAVCYAYLVDVSSTWRSAGNRDELLKKSEWFTRGWTLQELLAPKHVILDDESWSTLGTKTDLAEIISRITGIHVKFLNRPSNIHKTSSIAARMSWASLRKTTRKEDMAYCLLGLFDVNMTLLYGEGTKAFMRLQLEIIKKSDDETIFAWTSDDQNWVALAPSTKEFRNSGLISPTWMYDSMGSIDRSKPYPMTNRGLKLRSRLRSDPIETEVCDVLLQCCVRPPQVKY